MTAGANAIAEEVKARWAEQRKVKKETHAASKPSDGQGYRVRLSSQGRRCLYRDGILVATNLATSSDVDYAKKRDVALLEAKAWHRHMPKTGPGDAWKRLRGFLTQYELKRSHLYPIMRRVLGRKRDLRDGRQLPLLIRVPQPDAPGAPLTILRVLRGGKT